MGIIISNGIENKFGSLTAPYEFFNEWKKAESEEDKPKTEPDKKLEKRLDHLEEMISTLLTKNKEDSGDKIKNKLDFLEVLIKNINSTFCS
jgi:DNA-binding transcriptional MerR regulator